MNRPELKSNHVTLGENTLWLEFLNWRWKMVQVAEVYRIDVSEDEYEEMENPFCD